jgi:3-hydroxymyristoyl/3-hydroxydecanoyl-(acyl carrier protein) dehydratase
MSNNLSPHDEQEEVLQQADIMLLIPHRFPFLFIDKAFWSPKMPNVITTEKRILLDDIMMQGHFPEEKIFPGVLLLEAIAQSAVLLAKKMYPEITGLPRLKEFSGRQKFNQAVFPGDILTISAELFDRKLGRIAIYFFQGKISNQRNETVCVVECLKGVAVTV